jgi:glycosyltransferase involved in cell wall biosynthesis
MNKIKSKKLIIDASNIISGGGLTHLKEFIRHAEPKEFGFNNVVLWSSDKTLNHIDDKEWLIKCTHSYLNKSYFHRFYWKHFVLKSTLSKNNVLFIPGTGYLKSKAKVITMCRNLLPIDRNEMKRFFPSLTWLRYCFLRIQHFNAYKKADGVIFLNKYCLDAIPKKISNNITRYDIIPHGLNKIFKESRKVKYLIDNECNIIYLSRVNLYKHQWSVAKAVYELKNEGYSINLTLAGGMNGPGSNKLKTIINQYKVKHPDTVQIIDLIPYSELPEFYRGADIFIFASTCETFGNILLEAMGLGLPIACSNKSSMQELLHDAGIYFDPENVKSIKDALKKLLSSAELRNELGNKVSGLASNYSWEKTSNQTLKFLSDVHNQ